jgi:hypothetical protein
MSNEGTYPPDSNTNIGQLRYIIGDINATDISGNQGSYSSHGDFELTAFLLQGGDSVTRAAGYAYLQAAGSASIQSKQVKDYDLSVDLTKRAEDLRRTAKFYFGLADNADLIAGTDEDFIIADTGNDRDLVTTVEAAPLYFPVESPWPWGNG